MPAYISGTGGYVPPRVVTNDDLIQEFGIETSDEWIQKRTGIRARRFADDGVATSDMALEASRAALEMAGIEAQELDLIIFATLSSDFCFPGAGVILQQKLGLCEGKNPRYVPALDVRNQCSGFLYGLSCAAAHVQSGMAKHVLLVGAEKHSAALDLSTGGRTIASLFGDGAGAVVVSHTQDDRGLRDLRLGADGRHAEVLCQKLWDIRQRPFVPLNAEGVGQIAPEMLWAQMDGKRVFKYAVMMMTGALIESCKAENIELKDIDLFFFHQANLRINLYIAEQLGIPSEKLPQNIERYGNTTAATIPLLLDEAVRSGQLKAGMKIAMVGFGSGFTWGSAIVDW